MKYIEDSHLLKLRFGNGMMLLPYYHAKIIAHLNNQSFSGDGQKRPPSLVRVMMMLVRGIKNASFKKRKIVGLSNSRWEVFDEGRWKNIQHGYYYDLYPNDFLLVEGWGPDQNWKTSDSYESLSFVSTFITAFSHFIAKICNLFHTRYRNDFNVLHSKYSFISVKQMSYDDYFGMFYYYFMKWFLKKSSAQIVLMHCGSYGGPFGVICKLAKDMGIVTIDTQHAQIYHHKAYIAGEVVKKSKEYKKYLPDYLYTYGDYWSNCADWDYEKVIVGNPFLNNHVEKFRRVEPTLDYLVISQPIMKEMQIPFIRSLAAEFPEKIIYVRLHPYENVDEQKCIFKDVPNIEICSSSKNLYEEMCSSHFVIGWCSTCLYELLAFGKQPVIVRNELSVNNFPDDLGIWVDTAKDVRNISEEDLMKVEIDKIWAKDFDKRATAHLNYLLRS